MIWFFLSLSLLLIIIITLIIAKVPNNLVYITTLLVFFLPFTRIPTVEVMSYTLKINHIIGIILIVLWLFNLIKKRIKFTYSPIHLILFLLVLSQLVSITSAHLPSRAIIFFLTNIFTIILAVIVTNIIRKKEDLRLIEKAIFASVWLVLFFSLWQFFGDLAGMSTNLTGLAHNYRKIIFGFPRIQAFSKEPLYLGNYLFIPLGFLSAKFLKEDVPSKPFWFLLYLIIVAFILTLSRGALLGLAVFILMLIVLYPKKMLKIKSLSTVIIICLLSFASVFVVMNHLGPKTQQHFIDHLMVKDYGEGDSTVSRLGNNSIAIKDWRSKPIFGIGLGNFGASKDSFDSNGKHLDNIVNNEYLEILAETGIFGLSMFIILIGSIIFRSIQSIRLARRIKSDILPLLVGLTATFMAIFTQYAFFSTLSIIYIWVLIGLLLAVQNMAIKDYNKTTKNND